MVYSLKGIQKLLKDIEERQKKEEQKAFNKKVGYSPKCKVCNSKYLDEIEEARENGFTYEEIIQELNLDFSIMALSRHFKNHYPKSQAYKQKQQIQLLENIKAAYQKYPFLEDQFKDKPLDYLESFNNYTGFCTDKFKLCELIPASTVSNGNDNIFSLYSRGEDEVKKLQEGYYRNQDRINKTRFDYQSNINYCLNCKNQIQEERINLLEKIITYNFLNIPVENKELYYNLLNFNGNPEEFIQALQEANNGNSEDSTS